MIEGKKKNSIEDTISILRDFEVDADLGLSIQEVEKRKQEFGANVLRAQKPKRVWAIIWQQLKSIIVLLLVFATSVSFFLGEWFEGFAILAVLVVNTTIGFLMELRAVRSMEALRQIGRTKTTVIRNGNSMQVDAVDLVPGDIVLFEGGDIVAADMRLLEANRLNADESALTGESVPVDKRLEDLSSDVPIAERE